MLTSTTSVLDGKPVSKYLGVVTGEAIIGANVFRDLLASVRDIVGGRSATYERALAEAREVALAEMQQRAQELGGNAERITGGMTQQSTAGTGGEHRG